jgi:hypothetical protein
MVTMNAGWPQATVVFLPMLFGAIVGAVSTFVIERSRVRMTFHTRWDATLHATCAQFAVSARRLIDLAEGLSEPADADLMRDAVAIMVRERRRLQVLMAEIRLLADVRVQLAARGVVRHTWAMQQAATTGVGPPASGDCARESALAGLFEFYRAVRRQLRVPQAAELAPLNPPAEVAR